MDESLIDSIIAEKDEIKKAASIDKLLQSEQITVKELAAAVGKSSSYICNLRRIVSLPELVIDGYYAKSITASHLRILSRLTSESDIIATYEKILTQSLTTQEAEELVREVLFAVTPGGSRISLLDKDTIMAGFKTLEPMVKVSINQSRVRTRVVLDLYGGFRKTSRFLQKLKEQGGSSTKLSK